MGLCSPGTVERCPGTQRRGMDSAVAGQHEAPLLAFRVDDAPDCVVCATPLPFGRDDRVPAPTGRCPHVQHLSDEPHRPGIPFSACTLKPYLNTSRTRRKNPF